MRMSLTGTNTGFTFIEVMIIIVIIGISLAIVAPFFEGFIESAEINTTRRRIVNFIRTVREYAVTSESEQKIQIQDTGLHFNLHGEEKYLDLAETGFTVISSDIEGEEDDIIYFYPDGTGTGAIITFEYEEKETFVLEIGEISGSAEWRDSR